MAPRHGTKGMMTVIQVQEPLQSEHRAISGAIHKIYWTHFQRLQIYIYVPDNLYLLSSSIVALKYRIISEDPFKFDPIFKKINEITVPQFFNVQ